MQRRIANAKPDYIKGKNYRIRTLQSGELQIEFRSTKYDIPVKRLPKGTSPTNARKHAERELVFASDADVPELARKVLKRYTLNDLIDKFLKVASLSDRDRSYVVTFQKRETALCSSKTLDQHHMIVNGLDDYINRRKKAVRVHYTITRALSPLRAMYSNAGKQRLYGLIDDKIIIKNPFDEIDLPKDISGREQSLKQFEELKIFKAINEQCKSAIQRLKWLTVVNMALITCLRRGVLLRLKWRDIDWDNRWIKVSKSYWGTGKRAPEYVPITNKLHQILKSYYDNLPDRDKTTDIFLFESQRARSNRRKTIDKNAKKSNWIDQGWSAIVMRTNLWEPKKTPDGNTVYDENGIMERDWFHFHDLRHTAKTRYKVKPYGLLYHEIDYLMGHLGDQTKVAKRYDHSDKEFCDEIREKIDKGDALLARTLQKPGGDVSEPHQIAFNSVSIKMLQEMVQELLKSERDGLIQRRGAEYVKQLEELTKEPLFDIISDRSFDREKWLEAKAKADDFNQPREDYKRKYDVYPEDDTVMQVWHNSKGTTPIDEDRANAYLICQSRSVFHKADKEARYRFGIEARPDGKGSKSHG